MAGIKVSASSNHQTEAKQNEKLVQSIIETVSDMTNPFDANDELQSLSSGHVASEEVRLDLIQAHEIGLQASKVFIAQRITSSAVNFHAPSKLLKLKTFTQRKKATSQSKTSSKLQAVKRDLVLFSRLLVVSQVRQVDFRELFCYSLCDIPLALSSADGTMAKTTKSKLLHILEEATEHPTVQVAELSDTAMIFDAMAVINSLRRTSLPPTFRSLALFIFNKIKQRSRQFKATRIDFVCDRYMVNSIKTAERDTRAESRGTQRIKISYPDQKLPTQWTKYLGNSSNKQDLQRFLAEQWLTYDSQNLTIYTTYDTVCKRLPSLQEGSEETVDQLTCTHDEADTRLWLHAKHASLTHGQVIIASPDTDVAVIGVGVADQFTNQILMLTGKSPNERLIDITVMSTKLGPTLSKALPFMHAFTGCDTVSSFQGRGKQKAFNILRSKPDIAEAFAKYDLLKDIPLELEGYVCLLYGATETTVNSARYELFTGNMVTEGCLPPTKDALTLHTSRASYQCNVWRASLERCPHESDATEYGWLMDGDDLKIKWLGQPMAPPELLKSTVCRCAKNGCVAGKCSCRASGLVCTAACKCKNCRNQVESEDSETE